MSRKRYTPEQIIARKHARLGSSIYTRACVGLIRKLACLRACVLTGELRGKGENMKSSVLCSATRAPARPPKSALARILHRLFHRVFRTPRRDASTPVHVPPERARDAPQPRRGPLPECPRTPRRRSSVAVADPATPIVDKALTWRIGAGRK